MAQVALFFTVLKMKNLQPTEKIQKRIRLIASNERANFSPHEENKPTLGLSYQQKLLFVDNYAQKSVLFCLFVSL